MDSIKIKQIFKRYLERKSTASEKQIVDNWYQSLSDEPSTILEDGKENQIKEEIWLAIQPNLIIHSEITKKSNFAWLKIAASVLIISSVGLIAWKLTSREHNIVNTPVRYTLVSTKAGEIRQLTLPDGSLITLNSASTISVSNNYRTKREIRIIDGEAYFDVKHNKKNSFTIYSGSIITQVLGTSFNIRAYKDLNKMIVGVTSGKVGIIIKNKPTQFLVRDQQIIFDKDKAKITLSSLDKQALEWQQHKMVLNDASFDEMALLMYKNYGINISTQDKTLKNDHFTTTLNTSMPAIKALEVITAIHHLQFKQRRDTMIIYK